MTAETKVFLKPKEDRRIRSGSLWIFSNEIQRIEGKDDKGSLVQVFDSFGRSIGFGYLNRHSLIAIRMLSFCEFESLEALVHERLAAALSLRARLGYQSVYRLLFGESDFLPGLVVDRFDSLFVLESFSAGADVLLPIAAELLRKDFGAETIIENSDSHWREYEGVPPQKRILYGSVAEHRIAVGGISYIINHLDAQKTGFFLDQRENRLGIERYVQGLRVLDCCSNDGGFALHAARGGASRVDGIDVSARAVEQANRNAALNELPTARFTKGDVFDVLPRLNKDDYDMIILDPPAFVKSRNRIASGLKGYQKLNELALRALSDNGVLVTCSCSQHVNEALFVDMLNRAARAQKKQLRIIGISGASPDHPVLGTMPETRYLTCVTCFVSPL